MTALATAIHAELDRVFNKSGANMVPPWLGNAPFAEQAEIEGPVRICPLVAEIPEGTDCAVGFRLAEEPREPTVGGGLAPYREVVLQVLFAARSYPAIVVAGEFLAEIPNRLRADGFLADYPEGEERKLLIEIVDEGESDQDRDEDEIFNVGRNFTLWLATSF